MTAPAILAIAMLIDALAGGARRIWSRVPHPVALMRCAVEQTDAHFNHGKHRHAKGACAAATFVALAWVIGEALTALPFSWIVETLLTAAMLAQRSLADHANAVARALRLSVEDGRRSVAEIVGRDTADMGTSEVARAAAETVAGNLSDGFVAPAFWFLVAGLPGLLVYKIVNTADSMIGCRTTRHEAFGWAVTILDYLLNWMPARLTAALIAASHLKPKAWRIALRDARLHRSPYAGYPEAAMAAVLGIALSGPRSHEGQSKKYPYVHPEGRRELGPDDIDSAVAALWRSWALALALALALATALALTVA